jgi:hypothetical protein
MITTTSRQVIYCSDIEQFFNEYEIEDYVEQHTEDEDE